MHKVILPAVSLALLAGCVTPYGPQGPMGGYSDREQSPGVYQVTVNGNGYTARSTLTAYYRRRVREVCAEHGGEVVNFDEHADNYGQRWSVWGFVQCSHP